MEDLDLTEESLANHLGTQSRMIRKWANEGRGTELFNQALIAGLAGRVKARGAADVKAMLRALEGRGSSWRAYAWPTMIGALQGDRVKLEERLAANNLDAAIRGSCGGKPGELKYARSAMPSRLEDLSLEDLLALVEPNEVPWDRMAAALAS
jgi:hypothetical protein